MKDEEKYELVVGLEIHAQLSTESKLFCGDATGFGAEPNTQISVVSLAYPGTLPVLNQKAVAYAVKMGLACDCDINQKSWFDRKNYFYPDLPKGYQITQDASPICRGGYITIFQPPNIQKEIRLNRIHLEEDAGKSMHDETENYSRIDLNRAGMPLIEIVTEPIIKTADEASQVLYEIRKLVRYLGICDGNMEEGSLRCDANVSIRPKGRQQLGNKVEIKNMNSLRFVQKAIEFEFRRQSKLAEQGKEIISETRLFHPGKGETFGMREKETLNDYRYFPDPDLPAIQLNIAEIEAIRKELPILPKTWFSKFSNQYSLPFSDIIFLSEQKEIAEWFDRLATGFQKPKVVANWLMGPIRNLMNEGQFSLEKNPVSDENWLALFQLAEEGKISFSAASQQVLPQMLLFPNKNPWALAESLGILQQSDEGQIKVWVNQVLTLWPDKVAEYKKGKKGLIGLFVGEVRKISGGKADPKLCTRIIEEWLNQNP